MYSIWDLTRKGEKKKTESARLLRGLKENAYMILHGVEIGKKN
jgi:hypothetical protein